MLLFEADRILKSIYLQLIEDALNDEPLPTAEEIAAKTLEQISEQYNAWIVAFNGFAKQFGIEIEEN